ncbi:polyphosphate kinase 1 [Carboxylicivirga sp. M1479]|uniref:polyphosphate kinase 1 n=1 Tax=Carboxylicivirga sp. M1479 TaxID=2594476 RepID=UPI001177572C|nr:polyphosphate kinase 1 [Carboxylicivirga sp. M1479]TRX70911.1 polyphosphate kinase 1 [Carboxylicivirga sp. M1479]
MPIDQQFFNRDISWLSFNHRVLEEAKDTSLPLFERLKFLAIYSNNLDEFYKVRVAEYRNATLLPEGYPDIPDADQILEQINAIVGQHWIEYSKIFKGDILPLMEKNGITLHLESYSTKKEHTEFIHNFFHTELIPCCQPVVLNKGTRSFMRDNRLYLAVKLYRKRKKKDKKHKKRRARYALIKVPTNDHKRFIELPQVDDQYHYMFLDDAIRFGLPELFPGYDVVGSWGVKIARNADLGIEDEFWGDLVEKIRKNLALRKTGTPAGLYHDRSIPADVLSFLMKSFDIKPIELVETGSYQNLHDFFSLPNPYAPKLEWQGPPPIKPFELEEAGSMFEAIKRKERVLHYPYHSFDYVIQFLREAATDEKVDEIKVTQYRVASNSEVVGALIFAAHNKKKVTVFVEVKARFDEANNLYFAKQMEKAGIKIIYSIPGLKVHAKMALAIRRSNGVRKRSFAYLSTGNFNEKTARSYADHGFFTCNDAYLDDMEGLFKYLEDQNNKPKLNKLLITQINLRKGIMNRINREIELAQNGKKGYILLKMNGIQNKNLISKLYEASQAGVKVDLIVRGICCLVPEQSYSENIRVVRLVDSYLEHARIWVFGNDNNTEMFLSSADWLNRNINRRIETAFPIEQEELKSEILTILEMQLRDNVKVRKIDQNLNNIRIPTCAQPLRAQQASYNYLAELDNIIRKKKSAKKTD